MKTHEKIISLCNHYLLTEKTYNLNKHIAKNIILKIRDGQKLTNRDLDFITSLQFRLV